MSVELHAREWAIDYAKKLEKQIEFLYKQLGALRAQNEEMRMKLGVIEVAIGGVHKVKQDRDNQASLPQGMTQAQRDGDEYERKMRAEACAARERT